MTSREFRTRLLKRAGKVELAVTDVVIEGLEAYYRLLARWNQKINLTSLPLAELSDETVDRLLIEPLAAARHVRPEARSVIDIGSGGGSPALPLKVALPSLRLSMVEVKVRKCAFLREAVRTLALEGAEVENARFEELLTRPELHEAFDLQTMRAVRVEGRTLRTVQAFVRPGGQVFLFRGPSGELPEPLAPLVWRSTEPLVPSLRSRLVILEKASVPGR
ncbi:MAG: 16S rRNA (guanine(527)-N(7))-methyltransferase RsmG [Acidobacteriota bacterium]|nr:16S rRNA (guanine(527)-N(7))-methyltransferase RsmG [Acidobacteriota bacterium]